MVKFEVGTYVRYNEAGDPLPVVGIVSKSDLKGMVITMITTRGVFPWWFHTATPRLNALIPISKEMYESIAPTIKSVFNVGDRVRYIGKGLLPPGYGNGVGIVTKITNSGSVVTDFHRSYHVLYKPVDLVKISDEWIETGGKPIKQLPVDRKSVV